MEDEDEISIRGDCHRTNQSASKANHAWTVDGDAPAAQNIWFGKAQII
jgi:hypothetical protein